jgi:hypothetical protein
MYVSLASHFRGLFGFLQLPPALQQHYHCKPTNTEIVDTNASLITAKSVEADNASWAAALNEYEQDRTGPLTAPLISTIAFPAMRHFADDWVELIDVAGKRDIDETLAPGTPATVRAGYLARQYPFSLSPATDPRLSCFGMTQDAIL